MSEAAPPVAPPVALPPGPPIWAKSVKRMCKNLVICTNLRDDGKPCGTIARCELDRDYPHTKDQCGRRKCQACRLRN